MVDRNILKRAMGAAEPMVELKLPMENFMGQFQECIDGKDTNHHFFDDVPDHVFYDRWSASMTQTVTPETQTDHVLWLLEMGRQGETDEARAILANWLGWMGGGMCAAAEKEGGHDALLGEVTAQEIHEAALLSGRSRDGRPVSDYAEMLAFAERLYVLGKANGFLEEFHETEKEADFYHGLTFRQDGPGAPVEVLKSWADRNDDMDALEKIGEMDEENFRDREKVAEFIRENYRQFAPEEKGAPAMGG